MTIKIQVPPDIEADLIAQAKAQDLDLPRYVERLLRERVPSRGGATLTPAERAEAWRQAALGLPHTPPLSDEAISRESIYNHRGR
ncbi:MAG TPA: hypothetical protein VH640_26305 [Bryobacteraceae bacterium]|jgi:hypothetical protein